MARPDPDLKLLRKLPLAIRELLADDSRRLTETAEISTLKSVDVQLRGTYRLAFDDGSQVKARVLFSRPTIDFLVETLRQLPRGQFPQIVKSSSRGILEEWFNGECLDLSSEATYVEAGRFLGQLHQTSLQGREGARSAFCYRAWFEASLFQAITGEAIGVQEARRIHEFAMPKLPRMTEFVLTHRDLCPENLLVRSGQLCSIDNMSLAPRSRAEDLARTWCRWPMSGEQWRLFLAGYREFGTPDEFLAAPGFWIAFALVNSLAIRSRIVGPSSAAGPLETLRWLLDNPDGPFANSAAAA